MNKKQVIGLLSTVFALSSCIVNNGSIVSAYGTEVIATTNSYANETEKSTDVSKNATSSPESNNCASDTPKDGTSAPDSQEEKPNGSVPDDENSGNAGAEDPSKDVVEYVFYKKGDSVKDVADKIREYINKYNATSINGHPVSESNIEDVARKIMEESKNADTYDKNKFFVVILACAVSMFFGGKQRFCEK